ncbi:unnamed protein product [Callosobruchus maculatus]|uniref:C2H2-type domain-containing protein n=1 Tax=Callosobruchus maculatus TaxID=64391 RepID=A0A653CFX6_CALMS|nr:unnamed protein product [Callosobruchus maculatus]
MSNTNQFSMTSYSIPKRKADEMYSSQYSAYTNVDNPVLSNSYYNYYQQSQWPTVYPQPYQNVQNHSAVDPITQNIYNTLNMVKEKPKNYQKNVFRDTVPDAADPSLPKELTVLFQPLFCKLCSVQLSSNVMAKMHYKSKNHEKKLRKFLVAYSEKTGEPLHKRARVTASSTKTEEEQDPKWFHCDVCDLPLTGKLHAESHYMGKNHQKAMLGYKRPAGKGYYNAEGKWVRQTSTKKVLAPGEDTFGLDFRKSEVTVEAPPVPAVPTVYQPPQAQQHRFTCDMCSVVATCQEQLDMHLKGQKHQKKLRQLGLSAPIAKEPNIDPVPT